MDISQDDRDELIVNCIKPWGTKVAFVIGHVDSTCESKGLTRYQFDETVARIKALIQAGRLRSEGDLDEWGASELYRL